MRPAARKFGLDRLAIGLSGLCLIHCLGTLLLVATLASAGRLLANPLIHEIGLGLAILVGAIALGRGVIAHRRPLPMIVGGSGLTLMATALAVPHGNAEALLTMAGVALVATAHYLNVRAHR
jgi:hypothetical protein